MARIALEPPSNWVGRGHAAALRCAGPRRVPATCWDTCHRTAPPMCRNGRKWTPSRPKEGNLIPLHASPRQGPLRAATATGLIIELYLARQGELPRHPPRPHMFFSARRPVLTDLRPTGRAGLRASGNQQVWAERQGCGSSGRERRRQQRRASRWGATLISSPPPSRFPSRLPTPPSRPLPLLFLPSS